MYGEILLDFKIILLYPLIVRILLLILRDVYYYYAKSIIGNIYYIVARFVGISSFL